MQKAGKITTRTITLAGAFPLFCTEFFEIPLSFLVRQNVFLYFFLLFYLLETTFPVLTVAVLITAVFIVHLNII